MAVGEEGERGGEGGLMSYKSGMISIENILGRGEVVLGSSELVTLRGEWFIGGPEEAQALIDDLQAYIAQQRSAWAT